MTVVGWGVTLDAHTRCDRVNVRVEIAVKCRNITTNYIEIMGYSIHERLRYCHNIIGWFQHKITNTQSLRIKFGKLVKLVIFTVVFRDPESTI